MRHLVVVAALGLALLAFPAGALSEHAEGEDAIDVCCAWNDSLADGELTYTIRGGTADLQDAARQGVEQWDDAIAEIALTEAVGNEKADVTIKLVRGGSPFVAGQTNRKFELVRDGVRFFALKGATITIFGAGPGSEDDVEVIAAHEFGHGLGAGHANTDGYLMSESLDQIPGPEPEPCDIAAVEAANEWFFSDAGAPAPPSVDHVAC